MPEISIKSEQGQSFKSSKGATIHRVRWPLDTGKQPRAAILVCHGFGEHIMRYQNFAAFLNAKDFAVFGHDHVGHGKSDGERVMITSFDQYVDVALQHIEIIKSEHPDLPLFIIGHSMGGLIAAVVGTKSKNIQGAVFISGAFAYDTAVVTPFKRAVGRFISRLAPSFQLLWLKLDTLTHDKALLADYLNDPLVYHGGMKARWLLLFLEAMDDLKINKASVTYPCLILQGDQDQMVIPSAAYVMHEGAASSDKTLKIYKGFYHQLHYEPAECGELVRTDIADWLLARC